jgi:hypothetical protein
LAAEVVKRQPGYRDQQRMSPPQLPTTLAATRESLHRLAEHVLSPARRAVTGRIGLRPAPGGFATPPFGDDERVIAVDGAELVVRSSAGERRAQLRTLRAAAEHVGIEPGAGDAPYTPATPLEPDAALDLDPDAVRVLADWFQLGDEALARFAAEFSEEEPPEGKPSAAQLWPEHFDLGISAGGVNYGVSPGDQHVPVPYLYVGPHDPPPPGDDFFTHSFGAVRTIEQVGSVDDAVAFFRTGRDHAAAHHTSGRTA